MKRIPFLLILTSGLLAACTLMSTPPATVPPPKPWVPTATATLLPTATSTPADPTPTETQAPPTATAGPPTATATSTPPLPPEQGYTVAQEQVAGDYIIRLWRNRSPQSIGFDSVVTISRGGQEVVRIDHAAEIVSETGTDLTGEGHPDAVIEIYTGGAHCCFSTLIYDLGPEITKVLETPLSNCSGSFQDLTGDGRPEYVTCDDLFAYMYCPYAGSPAVQVIMVYQPGRGYVPASPSLAALYEQTIAQHRAFAENSVPGERGEWDGTTKCSVLPLILDYLYTDRPQEARAALETFYSYPDAALFWAEIVRTVSQSPLYALGAHPVQVPGPPYYMLQLLTNCGPGEQYIGLLVEGQAPCGSDVPRRDIAWLSGQLNGIGLIDSHETLLLTPQGCTSECRLDVVRMADNVRQGSIRLDTQVDYPGAVYRVNGTESERWRLRGDLVWERVAE